MIVALVNHKKDRKGLRWLHKGYNIGLKYRYWKTGARVYCKKDISSFAWKEGGYKKFNAER